MIRETSLLLPVIPFVPLLAAVYVAFAESGEWGRRIAFLCGTLPALVLGCVVTGQLLTPSGAETKVLTAWNGFLYADLVSALMIVLTFFLVTAVGVYSFAYLRHDEEQGRVTPNGVRVYYTLLLVFSSFMVWTVTIAHLFFIFLVVEIATIAISLLVATYKTKLALVASFKYNLLVVTGMLFAIMGAILIFGKMSAIDPTMTRIHVLDMGKLAVLVPAPLALVACAGFIAGFGTKGGVMPFHTWLPDAHSEAPAPISGLLSGLVIAIGPFVFLRTVTMFAPLYSSIVTLVAILGCVSVVVGILLALVQDDLKRLLAYSSVSQIGYIFVAVSLGTYLGTYGGLFHIVTHLLAKSLLFFCSGAIIYRLGIRRISDLAGLGRKMPVTAVCFFIAALSMGGLPPLAGFMSKYSIVFALAKQRMWWAMIVLAAAGTLTLAALVWAAYRMFWRQESAKVAALAANGREMPLAMSATMVVLATLIVIVGVFPMWLYPVLDGAARSIMALLP
jgi:hydrogenase-4 component F